MVGGSGHAPLLRRLDVAFGRRVCGRLASRRRASGRLASRRLDGCVYPWTGCQKCTGTVLGLALPGVYELLPARGRALCSLGRCLVVRVLSHSCRQEGSSAQPEHLLERGRT